MAASETHLCSENAPDVLDNLGPDDALTAGDRHSDGSLKDATRPKLNGWSNETESAIAVPTPVPPREHVTNMQSLAEEMEWAASEDASNGQQLSPGPKSEAKRRAQSHSPSKAKRFKTEDEDDPRSSEDVISIGSADRSAHDTKPESDPQSEDAQSEDAQSEDDVSPPGSAHESARDTKPAGARKEDSETHINAKEDLDPFEQDIRQVVIVELGAKLHEDNHLLSRYGERFVSGLRRSYISPLLPLSLRCPVLAAKIGGTAGVEDALPMGTKCESRPKPDPDSATPRGSESGGSEGSVTGMGVLHLPRVLPQVFAALMRWMYSGEVEPEGPLAERDAYHGRVAAVDVAMGVCELGREHGIPGFHDAGIDMIWVYFSIKNFDAGEFVHSAVERGGVQAPVSKYLLALCAFADLRDGNVNHAPLDYRGNAQMATEYQHQLFLILQPKVIAAKGRGTKSRSRKAAAAEKRYKCPNRSDYYLEV